MSYTWKVASEEFFNRGEFDTLMECIEDAKEWKVKDKIYIGEVKPYQLRVYAEDVLEALAVDAFENVGEIVDEWPAYRKKEDLEKLSDTLTKCVIEWLKENNDMPTFYRVDNVQEIVINE